MKDKHSINNKLVVLTSYPIHSEPVIRNRLAAYFTELSNAGWNVYLVTPESGPEGRTEDSVPAGVTEVVYLDPPQYDKQKFFARGLNEIRFAQRLINASSTINADVIIATVPSVFLLLFAFQKKWKVKVADVRDLVWEYLPDYPYWKKTAKYILKYFFLFSLRKTDIIASSNPKEFSYLQEALPSKQHVLVSNGIGKKQFEELSSLNKISDNDNVLKINYIGNVGLAQNLSTLVRAVANEPQFELNIIGHGNDFKNVESEVHRLKASNIFLHGRVPWNEVIEWYKKSDVLYAQLTEEFNTAMPSKLYEYLATGLPVVYGGKGTAVEILEKFENVEIVPPDSPEELKQSFLKVLNNGPFEVSKPNIEKIRREYIREKGVALLLNEIHRLYNKPKR